jgi:hypothetical protein
MNALIWKLLSGFRQDEITPGRGKTLCIQLATCPRIISVFNFDLGFSAKSRQIMDVPGCRQYE